MLTVHQLAAYKRPLAVGFFLAFCSGVGQTFFIAVFAGPLKSELDLSDGEFGGYCTLATLISGLLLLCFGGLADRHRIRWLGAGVVTGGALSAFFMAASTSIWMLVVSLLGLRFFGQAMLMHLAMTAMGRWFDDTRGEAVSVASLGYPLGEAILPISAVVAMSMLGWRGT